MLCHRYVREKQHVMRFRQHAGRIADDQIRWALLRMAAKEADHVRVIEENIVGLGGTPPTVTAFYCSHDNPWEYLRSDLDDERRCIAEIAEDKLAIGAEFPALVALLDRIEADANEASRGDSCSVERRNAAAVGGLSGAAPRSYGLC